MEEQTSSRGDSERFQLTSDQSGAKCTRMHESLNRVRPVDEPASAEREIFSPDRLCDRRAFLRGLAAGALGARFAQPAQARENEKHEPPATIEEYIKRHFPDAQKRIDALVQQLGSSSFPRRAAANEELLQMLQRAQNAVHPAPFGIDAYASGMPCERVLGQQAREYLAKIRWHLQPGRAATRIPPIRASAVNVALMLQHQSDDGVRMGKVDAETMKRLHETVLDIPEDRGSFWEIVDRLRRETGLGMRFDHRFITLTTEQALPLRLLAHDGQAGLFLENDGKDGRPRKAVMALEPRAGLLLGFQEADITAGPVLQLTLGVLPETGREASGYTKGWTNPARPAKWIDGGHWNAPDITLQTNIMRATGLRREQIDLSAASRTVHIGHQSISMDKPVRVPESFRVAVHNNCWSHVDFSETSIWWDRAARLLALSSEITFRNAHGDVLPSKIADVHLHCRQVDVTYDCPEEPATADISGFKTFDWEDRRTFRIARDRLRTDVDPAVPVSPLIGF